MTFAEELRALVDKWRDERHEEVDDIVAVLLAEVESLGDLDSEI